jgi:hypothetical protein
MLKVDRFTTSCIAQRSNMKRVMRCLGVDNALM